MRIGPPSEDRWLLSPNLAAQGEDWLPVGQSVADCRRRVPRLAALEGITLPEPSPGVTPEARARWCATTAFR